MYCMVHLHLLILDDCNVMKSQLLYTEFIKMVGVPERGILGLTEYLFMDFFHPKKTQEYHSCKEKQKT